MKLNLTCPTLFCVPFCSMRNACLQALLLVLRSCSSSSGDIGTNMFAQLQLYVDGTSSAEQGEQCASALDQLSTALDHRPGLKFLDLQIRYFFQAAPSCFCGGRVRPSVTLPRPSRARTERAGIGSPSTTTSTSTSIATACGAARPTGCARAPWRSRQLRSRARSAACGR